jgi:hypothetical protein
MFCKRNVIILSVVIVGMAAYALSVFHWALETEGKFMRRLRAGHVNETVFLSAGHRRLAEFFVGISPDPHWSARKALQATRGGVPRCTPNRERGVLARMAAIFEFTAYAQLGQCQASMCGGCYTDTASGACADCGSGSYV